MDGMQRAKPNNCLERIHIIFVVLHVKLLQEASIFSKLDLRNTNHIIWIEASNDCKLCFKLEMKH